MAGHGYLPGLEEELLLDGLSLEGESGRPGGPISPRTIKRPTNPVALLLEKSSSRLTPADAG